MHRILKVKTSDIDNQEILQASVEDGNINYDTMDGIHTFEDDSGTKFLRLEETLKRLEIPFDSYSMKDGEPDHGVWCSYRPKAEEKYGCFNMFGSERPKGWTELQNC